MKERGFKRGGDGEKEEDGDGRGNGEGRDEVLSCGMSEGEGGGEGFEGAVVEDIFADLGVIASWYRLGSRHTRVGSVL